MQVPGDPVSTGCELTVGQPTVSVCTAGSQLIDLRCIPGLLACGYVRRSPDRNRAVPVEGGEQRLRLPGLGSVPIRLPAPSPAAPQGGPPKTGGGPRPPVFGGGGGGGR